MRAIDAGGVWLWAVVAFALSVGCGDNDDGATEADRLGVGAECTSDEVCQEAEQGVTKRCLLEFKGGYCGVTDCERNSECPAGSACVSHEGKSYCFRSCVDKQECNANRSAENLANCSSSVVFLSGKKEGKVCVPPSGT